MMIMATKAHDAQIGLEQCQEMKERRFGGQNLQDQRIKLGKKDLQHQPMKWMDKDIKVCQNMKTVGVPLCNVPPRHPPDGQADIPQREEIILNYT